MAIRWQVCALVGVLSGCGPSPLPRARAPEAPTGLAKCSVMASRTNPLVTEWPASEKVNLEARLRSGGVAVAYSGCELQLLPDCVVGGRYTWHRTSVARDRVEIRNEDELYAKLPLGAMSLEGELRSSGQLEVQTTVGGQLRLEGTEPSRLVASGACRGATHVISALSVGAFELRSGARLDGRVEGSMGPAEGGVATTSAEQLLREAGDPASCQGSTDDAPHVECSSPLQVFLTPTPWERAATVPRGKVRVAFASSTPEDAWEVVAGGRSVCTTPCEQLVSADAPLLLRDTEPMFLSPSDEIEVAPLAAHDGRAVEVRADGFSFGLFSAGLATVSVGGLGAIMGAIFLPLGCGDDARRPGLCGTGIGTLVAGAVAAGAGVLLIVLSGPSAEVLPLGTVEAPDTTSVWFGPGGVGGRF